MSCNSDSQDQFDSEDSEIKPESISSVSKKSQTIKKKKGKQTETKTNWNFGRPGKLSQLPSEQDLFIQNSMRNIWFCTDISMKCLIYLCTKGNMILKVKTGKPAQLIKKDFLDYFGKAKIKSYKKYKKDFKKQLKEKNIAILKHLGYSEKTTYLFLSNNNGDQIDLKLECVSNETRQGLLSLIRYLSSQFTYTYKVIVECFYSCLANGQENDQNTIVDTIVKELQSDKINHKMIFDMQLIQELLLDDFELLSVIENEPEKANLNLSSKMHVNPLNFNTKSFKDLVESIEEHSYWLNNFIKEFVEILKQYQ